MREDLHVLAGPYALDALRDDERAAFEHHLAGCEACATEIGGFAETTARMAGAVAEPPPFRLRGQVLDGIGRVRQLPPIPASSADEMPPRNRPISDEAPRHGRPSRRRRRSWRPRLAVGMAAACLAAAVGSGVVAVRTQQRLDRTEAAARETAAVLAAPDARSATGRVASGGTVTIVTSRSLGQAVFAASELRPLPAARTYQLWLMSSGGVRPAGLLRPDGDGGVRPFTTGPLRDADRVGLTVEPDGGSQQPTTPPILALRMPRT